MTKTGLICLGAVAIALAVFPGVTLAGSGPTVSAAARAPELPEVARAVPVGGALRVVGVRLQNWGLVDLELERFNVFAHDATIEVVNGQAMPVPDVAYFRGRLDTDRDALVMLAVPAAGKGQVHGIVSGTWGTWMMENKPGASEIDTREIDPATAFAGRTFECGVDRLKVEKSDPTEPRLPDVGGLSAIGVTANALPADVTHTAHMIVDTDYEYWAKFWALYGPDTTKTAAAAIEYLGDLLAYASTAYEREVQTNLLIDLTRLWPSEPDPYEHNDNACGCTGEGKLDEVQDEWSGNSTPRTLVLLVSGKTEGCGCAYIGVLCSQGSGYAATSGIGTGFNIDDPGYIWEGMVIAHEIGHNFGSDHTHAYCGVDGIDDPVDLCVDGEGSCSGDLALGLPGLGSLTGGTTAEHPGTIMSYCHQVSGGYANIAHTFGLYHPYGVAAWRVPDVMLAHVLDASCMSLEYTGSDLRVLKDCKPDDPLKVGETATCTVTVENLGPDTALGARAVDKYLSDGVFTIGTITLTKGSTTITPPPCTVSMGPLGKSGTVTCNMGDIDADHVVTIEVPVTAATPQNVNDRVEVSSDSDDPIMINNAAEDQVNFVDLKADLRVRKDCKPDAPQLVGSLVTCTLIVDNIGPDAAENVDLVDTHIFNNDPPVSVTITETPNLAACNVGGGGKSLGCTWATMAAGSSITVVYTVGASGPVEVNDTVAVSSDTPDPDSHNNTAEDHISFYENADLRVAKDCKPDDPILVGEFAVCTVTIENLGPSAAVNVDMNSTILSNGSFTVPDITPSVAATCNGTGPHTLSGVVSCTFASLDAGATVSVVYTVGADGPQDVNDRAVVSSDTPDSNMANNVAEDHLSFYEEADLSVTKLCKPDGPMPASDVANCTVTIRNLGPSTAVNLVLEDQNTSNGVFTLQNVAVHPPSPACTIIPGDTHNTMLRCTWTSLAAGGELGVTYEVTADEPQDVNDIATLSAATKDPNKGNNVASDGITIVGSSNLRLLKEAPSSAAAGLEFTYHLTVSNRGPSDAKNVVVKDFVPAGVTIVHVDSLGTPAQVTCQAGEPGNAAKPTVCTFDTIPEGETRGMNILVHVLPETRGILHNDASASSDNYDPDNRDNVAGTDTTINGVVDVEVHKTATPSADVVAGTPLTYTIWAFNNGPSTATGVVLLDAIPVELTYTGYSIVGGSGTCTLGTPPPNTLVCTLNNLGPDQGVTVLVNTVVNNDVSDGTSIENCVQVQVNEDDSDGSNNGSCWSNNIIARGDLAIQKDAVLDTQNPAPRITYTLTVRNLGPSKSLNVVATDYLPLDPKKFVFVYTGPDDTCSYTPSPNGGANHYMTCNFGDMPVGAVRVVNFIFDPRGSVGLISNIAEVTADTIDPNPGNNVVRRDVRVKGGPGIGNGTGSSKTKGGYIP